MPKSGVSGLGKFGTPNVVSVQQNIGGLPSFNFTRGVFDGWKTIDGHNTYEAVLKGRETEKQDQEGRDTYVHGREISAFPSWDRR